MQDSLVKSGQTILQMSLKRGPAGIIVWAKAHPLLEDMIKGWGDGTQVAVNQHGRYWAPLNGQKLPACWHLQTDALQQPLEYGPDHMYRFDRLGTVLFEEAAAILARTGRSAHVINLGFLRMVGISEGDGVTFVVKGVYSREALQQVKDSIMGATRRLYTEFAKPVEYVITMSSQEVK